MVNISLWLQAVVSREHLPFLTLPEFSVITVQSNLFCCFTHREKQKPHTPSFEEICQTFSLNEVKFWSVGVFFWCVTWLSQPRLFQPALETGTQASLQSSTTISKGMNFIKRVDSVDQCQPFRQDWVISPISSSKEQSDGHSFCSHSRAKVSSPIREALIAVYGWLLSKREGPCILRSWLFQAITSSRGTNKAKALKTTCDSISTPLTNQAACRIRRDNREDQHLPMKCKEKCSLKGLRSDWHMLEVSCCQD